MAECKLCPRNCGVERNRGESGYCRVGALPVVARAGVHLWEEPCISGRNGSGTVFFSGCNLRCRFCQNYEISAGGFGKEISVKRLREIFHELCEKGVHNINLVNPTHFTSAVLEALDEPLPVPVVWNTGGYESVETLRRLEGKIQIYLPDIKYSDNLLAARYSGAPDYFETACSAVKEMFRQTGKYEYGEDGTLKRGVVIRHLILPDAKDNTLGVIDFVADNFKRGDVLFSLMSQYTPHGDISEFPELCRRITDKEYESAKNYLFLCGITDGFFQEQDSAQEEYIPTFDLSGV